MFGPIGRLTDEAGYAALCVQSGLLGYVPPHRLPGIALAFKKYGGSGALPVIAAARYGSRTAIIDERGSLAFRELDERSNALANAFRARGLRTAPGDRRRRLPGIARDAVPARP